MSDTRRRLLLKLLKSQGAGRHELKNCPTSIAREEHEILPVPQGPRSDGTVFLESDRAARERTQTLAPTCKPHCAAAWPGTLHSEPSVRSSRM
jgi:hypothetical protein